MHSFQTNHTIDAINKYVVDSLTLRMDINELGDLINRVAVEAKTMLEYTENYVNLDRSTLKNFAEWTVSPQSGAVQGMLNRMHTIVGGSADLQLIGKQSLLRQLSLYLQVQKPIMVRD